MLRSLLVGIIGARVGPGSAKESHVPAVQKLTGLELADAATNSPATADALGRAFDAAAYGGEAALSAKVA